MTSPSKKEPERRGPGSPRSPDNLDGIEQKRSNPDGATPAEVPTKPAPEPDAKRPSKPAGH